ncbi:hypothetical protein OROGR_006563 [Orobanche gracilis]
MDEEIRRSSEIDDWIRGLLPDFAADINIRRSGYNHHNNKANTAIMTSNNNNNNNNSNPTSMWQQHPQLGSTLFQDFSHNHQTSSNTASERPNIYQFPTRSNPYPNNSRQNRQAEVLNAQGVGNQAQTTRLGSLQAFPESTSQTEAANYVGWVDEAYQKILKMKEMFLPDVLILYKRAQEARKSFCTGNMFRKANNAETVTKSEKLRTSTEKVINFLRMSRSDILRWRMEKLHQSMNDIVKFLNHARAINSHARKQNQRVPEPQNGGLLESVVQFNSTQPQSQPSFDRPKSAVLPSNQKGVRQTGFDQRAFQMFVNQTQPNSTSSRDSVTPVSNTATLQNQPQQNDQAVKRRKSKQHVESPRRFAGLGQRWSPLTAGSGSPQNAQQSKSKMEMKDLLSLSSASKFSKSGTVSVSASPSAFPAPLTPLTPCSKPIDIARSPLSIEDQSCRFPQNSADSQLPDTSRNLIVADAREVMRPGVNTVSTEKAVPSRDEEGDPVKRLVDAVTAMSPRSLNSAIQDMDAVTSLTDRIATNFVHGDSTKVVFHDLVDDIRKFRMQSPMKDQTETETQYCSSGSGERLEKEPTDMLLQEIKEINQRFMEVKVDVMNMDHVLKIGFEGVVIRCSYVPVGPASQQMIHKLLLELIVPVNYPSVSPTASERMPHGCGDSEDGIFFWTKANSSFSLRLRKFSQPITIKQMARAWEVSAREVFVEYAELMGGGSFSASRCGEYIDMKKFVPYHATRKQGFGDEISDQ